MKCEKSGNHTISYQSLLLSTTVLNDYFTVRPPYSPRLIVLDNPNVVFLICDTKVRHELDSGEYNIRRDTCAAAADKMGKPSLRDASIHDLESMHMRYAMYTNNVHCEK